MENYNSPTLGPKGMIRRTEFVRIIIQSLYSLGYKKAASLLESESGISCVSPELSSIQSQILDARWDDCIRTLNSISDLVEETRASASFLVFRQCLLELLNSGDESSALRVLQKRISPLRVDRKRVHMLACDIISLEEIGSGGKDGMSSIGELRRRLLTELEGLLPPPITLPESRLKHLVETAVTIQREACLYHNSTGTISLYEDHCCTRDQIPTETVQILDQHENEVWFVQFSNNGEYLASSSSDCTAIIWTVSEGTVLLKHILRSHRNPVSFVSWSPDDTMLLTCGNEEVLKLWDVETGTCKHTFGERSPIVSSCAWFPDSKRLVSGSCNPDKCIYTWDIQGNELDAWRGVRVPKVSDLVVTPDGEHLIIVCDEKEIQIYNFQTRTERFISEDSPITSLSVSKDSRFLIVNLNSQEIHMWDVAGKWDAPFKYTGHKQGQYVIRSCFGGSDCAFIASGSENSQIYIWHRQSCKLIEILPGHSKTVNCVSWNLAKPRMLASASDDHTIRIWGASRSKPEKVGA
ncbi:WD repeat-containing protein WDS homolog [Magnolia sinica]|uniref:WD repeat-containing protein WDS homolog n=1 Tax=Magnolia sinica TaxID=86752 RepID=UPI002658E9CD|nr:WD repeat-containing protein WDS homolog [Magnolia sinica]